MNHSTNYVSSLISRTIHTEIVLLFFWLNKLTDWKKKIKENTTNRNLQGLLLLNGIRGVCVFSAQEVYLAAAPQAHVRKDTWQRHEGSRSGGLHKTSKVLFLERRVRVFFWLPLWFCLKEFSHLGSSLVQKPWNSELQNKNNA